jgi:hypothetical protein
MNNRIPLHLWTLEAHFSSIFKIRCIRPSATLVTHRALVRQLVRIGSQGNRGRWPGCRRKVSLLVKAGVPRSRLWESGIPKDRMCHESDLSLLVNNGWRHSARPVHTTSSALSCWATETTCREPKHLLLRLYTVPNAMPHHLLESRIRSNRRSFVASLLKMTVQEE